MKNCFCAHSSVILVFISLVASQLRNIHQNNPLVSAETVCHSSTYIILYVFGEQTSDYYWYIVYHVPSYSALVISPIQ